MEFFLGVVVFALGLVVGSFINVVGLRVPKNKTIFGRSRCHVCQKTLGFRELLPVFSFIWQKGVCRNCGTRLSWQYPLVELLVALWFLLSFLVVWGGFAASFFIPHSLFFIFYLWLLGAGLFAIIIADWHYQVIPDALVVVLTLTALLWLAGNWVLRDYSVTSVLHNFTAAGGAGAFIGSLWWLTKGAGMGFGDVKLAAAMGLVLGPAGVTLALFISFIVGALVGIALMLFGGKNLKSAIPFGPFLAGSTLVVMLLLELPSFSFLQFFNLF